MDGSNTNNIPEYSTEILIAYLNNDLNDQQMSDIRKDIDQSDELKSILEGLKFFEEGNQIDQSALNEFLSESLEQQNEIISSNTKKKPTISKFLVAATVAFFMIGGWFLVQILSGPNVEEFMISELQPYELRSVSTRGSLEQYKSWEKAYQNQEWASAVELIEKELPNEELQFYMGQCQMQLDEYDKAAVSFGKVLEYDNPTGYLENARWYLILANLKLGDENLAIDELEKLISSNQIFKREEASKLLVILNKD